MRSERDGGLMVIGMLLGLVTGAVVALFFLPVDALALRRTTRREIEQLRGQTNRVNTSLIEGRAAVQERLTKNPMSLRRS